MAGRRLDVTVNVQGADRGAQQMDQYARSAENAANATTKATDSTRKFNEATQTLDPSRLAGRQLSPEQQAASDAFRSRVQGPSRPPLPDYMAVNRDYDIAHYDLRRSRPGLPANMGMDIDHLLARDMRVQGGGGESLLGSSLSMGSWGRLAGAYAIGGAIHGAGRGLGEIAGGEGNQSDLAATGTFLRNIAEGVPIISNLVKGFGDAGEALSGFTSTVSAAQRNIEASNRRLDLADKTMGIQSQARRQVSQYESELGGLGIDAATARGQRDLLTPGNLRRYVNLQNPAAGEAAFGVDAAGVALTGAQARLAAGQAGSLPGLREAAEQARIRAEEQEATAGRLGLRATALERAHAASGFWGRAEGDDAGVGESRSTQLRRQMVGAQGDAATAAAEAVKARSEYERRNQELMEAQKRTAEDIKNVEQKRYDLAQARIAVEKSALADKMKELDVAKNLAATLGGGPEGLSSELLEGIKEFKKAGKEGIDPEIFAQIQAVAPDWTRNQLIQRGQQDPNTASILQELGVGGAGVVDLEQQARNIAETIKKISADANVALKEGLEQGLRPVLKDLIDTIVATSKSEIEKAKMEISGKQYEKAVQQQAKEG